MSYSFAVRADTKVGIAEKIASEFDNVVAQQPIHTADRDQAQAAALAFLEVIPDTEGQDFYVSVSGSVGWTGTSGVDAVVTAAGASISASLRPKETLAATDDTAD